jgi:hypothetical protein
MWLDWRPYALAIAIGIGAAAVCAAAAIVIVHRSGGEQYGQLADEVIAARPSAHSIRRR